MKSNNRLRLMGECSCTRSKRNSISFSRVHVPAHIPGILQFTPRYETPKLMWVMSAGSEPGFTVISCYYLLLYEYYWCLIETGSLNQRCKTGRRERLIKGWNELDCYEAKRDENKSPRRTESTMNTCKSNVPTARARYNLCIQVGWQWETKTQKCYAFAWT